MILNHLKFAWRNTWKNKIYSLIKIIVLSIGLASCLLISLFVWDELGYDKHLQNADNIYRISGQYSTGGNQPTASAMTSYLIKENIASNFASIKTVCRIDFSFSGSHIRQEKQHFWEPGLVVVDSSFFQIFVHAFIQGDQNVLNQPEAAVITEKIAQKYFGDTNPMGREIEIRDKKFYIAGIVRTLPENTHYKADIYLPMHGVMSWYPKWVSTNISGYGMYTYVQSHKNLNKTSFEEGLNNLIADVWPGKSPPKYFLQSLKSIHLHSNIADEIRNNGSIKLIYIFCASAFIMLLLACINYVNLSIVDAFKRGTETGIKKVYGASKAIIIGQFQVESFILVFFSAIVSIFVVNLFIPYFNQLTLKSIDFNLLQNLPLIGGLLIISLFISIITGSFPAVFLFKIPVSKTVTKKTLNVGNGKFTLKNMLVTTQFAISVTLIVCTLTILNQLRFLMNKDIGVNPKQIVMVPFQTLEKGEYESMKEELLENSLINNVSASSNKVTNRIGSWRGYKIEGKEEWVDCPTIIVSHDFFKTMDAKILSGRDFQHDILSDEREAYIINESAVKLFDLQQPTGKSISGATFSGSRWSRKDAKIIGVVNDFNFESLHKEVKPLIFSLSSKKTSPLNWMEIRVTPDHMSEALSSIKTIWDKFSPDRPFRYELMEDELQKHYNKEVTVLKIISTFSIVSIVIACLGLFGTTAFIIKGRTKEIGIRKVLGANLNGIVILLSKDYMQLIILANIVGWLLGYFYMKDWLQNFAYRAPFSWEIYIITGIGVLAISLISIISNALITANRNPVKSLRQE
ncbi:ABC transporter permease [Xanthovirga aplysinae]|uniref:ABC transporter permease n=1 Tax=Xanthovirga aplysinae TaxID=2529853 RepID=UPI0012BBB0CD|nr:ABC transporter permease [Xanthovirga aplysinae]MTI33588.1 FtsX-like permease family protein [Xanthovirga aplysinae]